MHCTDLHRPKDVPLQSQEDFQNYKGPKLPEPLWTNKKRKRIVSRMDEGRKRVIGIMAAILASLHMRTADDLFGTPNGSPRTDRLIEASIQWAERIMQKIDSQWPVNS